MKKDKLELTWVIECDWLYPEYWASVGITHEEVVLHRGHVYPPRFEATWVREDGLRVKLEVEVEARRGPVPMSVTISSPNGVEGDYRQPITSMTRYTAAEIAWVDVTASEPPGSEPGFLLERPKGLVPMGLPAKRTDAARLGRIAELYEQAVAEGLRVTELIEKEEHVSAQTAYGLIRQARKAGLLAPSKPGRKGLER